MGYVAFVLKILLVSAAIAIGIKYGATHLTIPISTLGILIAVFLPSVVMLALFSWIAARE